MLKERKKKKKTNNSCYHANFFLKRSLFLLNIFDYHKAQLPSVVTPFKLTVGDAANYSSLQKELLRMQHHNFSINS